MTVLAALALALVGSAACWWGSGLLETATGTMAKAWNLPAVVQGALLVAVGSSFPELSSTVLATALHGELDLGVAAIVGSALFNVLVIPGLAVFLGGKLEADRNLVYKDAQFYVISVAVLLLVFALAVIYEPTDTALHGTVTRPLAVIPLALYGLYLFLQAQDTRDHQVDEAQVDGRVTPWTWLRLVASLALIVAGAEGLVRAALLLGEATGAPSFLWGVTVIAAGTSVPDSLVSVRMARRGEGVVSLANVLGSNVFDLLVAVPVAILIAGAMVVDFSVAAPMMGCLTLATIALFAFLRTSLVLHRWEAGILLGLYAAFLGWMILETIGITTLVR